MKKIFLLIVALIVSSISMAQSKIQSEVPTFGALRVEGNIELTLEKSDASSFVASVEGVESDKFEWSVKNGELLFKLRQPLSFAKKDAAKVKITLKYKSLEIINVAGATILASGIIKEP
ncbi:MAG: DUF2807 domain-containing protein, partial [Rikenellaceae bacterium]